MTVKDAKHVAGKKSEVSAGFPTWASNDLLLFTSDESGYGNPWTYSLASGKASAALAKPVAEDFAEPAWNLSRWTGVPLDTAGRAALFTAVPIVDADVLAYLDFGWYRRVNRNCIVYLSSCIALLLSQSHLHHHTSRRLCVHMRKEYGKRHPTLGFHFDFWCASIS